MRSLAGSVEYTVSPVNCVLEDQFRPHRDPLSSSLNTPCSNDGIFFADYRCRVAIFDSHTSLFPIGHPPIVTEVSADAKSAFFR